LPRGLYTDAKRLQQVLKNLLSNAFKFTHSGSVALQVAPAAGGWRSDHDALGRARAVVAFSVCDTGIGIPAEKQQIIFEAFQQADGSTSRKYGGTGLGLAISRELSALLGGELRLKSTVGMGSLFTLYLPVSYVPPKTQRRQTPSGNGDPAPPETPGSDAYADTPVELSDQASTAAAALNLFGDDRDNIQPGDRVLLVVDNDASFAKIALDVAREQHWKGLVTTTGAAALALARDGRPDAITLDLRLPDIDGWRVLDRLKNDAGTRHIPVYIITTEEEQRERGRQRGALGVLTKPLQSRESLEQALIRLRNFVERPTRSLLVVTADPVQRQSLLELLADDDARATVVASADEALSLFRQQPFDCVVLDPQLPDMATRELMDAIARAPELCDVPVLLYERDEPTKKDRAHRQHLVHTMVLKEVRSLERLVDQTALYLHRPIARLPEVQRQMVQRLHESDEVLRGRKVLIVDDDVRNIFAMTSVLEQHQMAVLSAEDGRSAIEILSQTPDIDVVLMDIMMPDMDGYETLRTLRRNPKLRSLPMIAVTAKAMKGDREKCLEAGAWDYLSKPVDSGHMLSVLRAWLHR
jgi:CheY-like chemotaxis protein